jgi:hypothetical protein
MTLKEEFTKSLYQKSHDDSECLRIRFGNIDEVIDLQVKKAEEFAIGFADWFHENCYEDQVGYYTASELLEIYKKEQGL